MSKEKKIDIDLEAEWICDHVRRVGSVRSLPGSIAVNEGVQMIRELIEKVLQQERKKTRTGKSK